MKNAKLFVSAIFFVALATLSLAGPRAAADSKAPAAAAPAAAWLKRCEPPKEGEKTDAKAQDQCEIFQRLVVEESGQRVAEFAIGFPEQDFDKGKGIIILPLGILLTEDVVMQIDGGKKVKLPLKFCTTQGCFAEIPLNKKVLEEFGRSKVLNFTGRASNGQSMKIVMTLEGFDKALAELRS